MADKIRGITIELEGDTSKLTASLKGVNNAVKSTQRQLKDVERLLKLDPKNTELLRQKQQLLARSIQETKSKLQELKNIQATMDANGVDKNSEQYQALQREIIETENRLKQLEQEYSRFGSVAAQQIAAVGHQMQELGQKVTAVGQKLTTALSVPIVTAAAAGVAKFAEFDKTMTLVNQTMGNSAEEADLLRAAIDSAAAQSTFSMADAATAVLNFARAGLNAEQAAQTLAPAMNLAAGAGGELDTVSAGLVATINGFGDSFANASTYADVFAAACNNSALDVNSLSSAMSIAAPIFRTAGYSVNDAALYMGVMANNGIDANTAANALKTGIARLASPTSEAADMMSKLGLEIFNADGSMKDSLTVQSMLHESFARLSEEEQIAAASAIFGKNQMSNWLALINAAPADVNRLSQALGNCAGTTNAMAQAMMSGFGGAIEQLKSSLDVLMTRVGEIVAEIITPLIAKIQELINKFLNMDEGTQKLIVTIALIVAAAGPLLIIIGKVISAVGTILTFVPRIVSGVNTVIGIVTKIGPLVMSAVHMISGGLTSLFTMIAANPVILVIMAIIAAVALLTVFIITHLDQIKAYIAAFREMLSETVANVKTAIANGIQSIQQSIIAGLSNALAFVASLSDTIRGLVDTMINSMAAKIAAFVIKVQSIGQQLIGVAHSVYAGMVGIFNGIQAVASSIAGGISSFVSSICNAVIAQVNAVIAWLRQVAAAISGMFGGGGGSVGVGRVGRMAVGGTISQGASVVGENGPELLTMVGNKAQITPLTGNQAETALSRIEGLGGSDTKVYVNFTGSLSQLARVLQPVIQVETDRRGPSLVKA